LRAGRAADDPRRRLRASLEGALPLDAERRRHWLVTLTFCTQATDDRELAEAQRDAYREFRDHIAGLVRLADVADAADSRAVAERLIAAADGIAIQALFDAASWPADRQRHAFDALLEPFGL
jgi:hypothetical protein